MSHSSWLIDEGFIEKYWVIEKKVVPYNKRNDRSPLDLEHNTTNIKLKTQNDNKIMSENMTLQRMLHDIQNKVQSSNSSISKFLVNDLRYFINLKLLNTIYIFVF